MKMIQSMKRRISGAPPPAQSNNPAPTAAGYGANRAAPAPARTAGPARAKKPDENPLYLLKDVPANEKQDLFKQKLQLCAITHDFNDPHVDSKEKEYKRVTLLELVDYVNNTRSVFTEAVMGDVVYMVSSNLFRSLPPSNHTNGPTFDPEEDEPSLDPAWSHLQIVYEFFLRFVVSGDVDPKVAKKYVDTTFILKLLELFNSEDPRERDYLKTVLHRIYGKFMALRSFIRKSIQHVFFKFIYEVEHHNGIAELLEILGSIINGFAQPLKDEHKIFLERALIPLHQIKTLSQFHQQLSYCMTQYIEKEPGLAETVINGLLKYWPVTNSPKEMLFLNEIEEIIDATQPAAFQRFQVPLFKQLAKCINSPHFQVSERALFLFMNNLNINTHLQANRYVLFPILVGPLFKNSKSHWNHAVHELTSNVMNLLVKIDHDFFDACNAKIRADEERQQQLQEERARKWSILQAKVSAN
eukprot:GILI01001818.1.p1 GENE.GILI01001818.1~~GILI01001818.1.p1  ORF type:complete len:470 (+),score=127.00 GILI01001818.1:94-1503(+)